MPSPRWWLPFWQWRWELQWCSWWQGASPCLPRGKNAIQSTNPSIEHWDRKADDETPRLWNQTDCKTVAVPNGPRVAVSGACNLPPGGLIYHTIRIFGSGIFNTYWYPYSVLWCYSGRVWLCLLQVLIANGGNSKLSFFFLQLQWLKVCWGVMHSCPPPPNTQHKQQLKYDVGWWTPQGTAEHKSWLQWCICTAVSVVQWKWCCVFGF